MMTIMTTDVLGEISVNWTVGYTWRDQGPRYELGAHKVKPSPLTDLDELKLMDSNDV